jgi:hexosaminidase
MFPTHRYSYRGLLIDSGRHFLPISHVKHVVEAAAMLKLSVIHWHIVDSQSFASCSASFPSLCANGA